MIMCSKNDLIHAGAYFIEKDTMMNNLYHSGRKGMKWNKHIFETVRKRQNKAKHVGDVLKNENHSDSITRMQKEKLLKKRLDATRKKQIVNNKNDIKDPDGFLENVTDILGFVTNKKQKRSTPINIKIVVEIGKKAYENENIRGFAEWLYSKINGGG